MTVARDIINIISPPQLLDAVDVIELCGVSAAVLQVDVQKRVLLREREAVVVKFPRMQFFCTSSSNEFVQCTLRRVSLQVDILFDITRVYSYVVSYFLVTLCQNIPHRSLPSFFFGHIYASKAQVSQSETRREKDQVAEELAHCRRVLKVEQTARLRPHCLSFV